MLTAVGNVNGKIADALKGKDAADQGGIDKAMLDLDGTANKKELGANAVLGVSLASAKPPPPPRGSRSTATSGGRRSHSAVPMMNIINGGSHSDAPIDFQEFMIMPKGAPSFSEALRYGAEIFHSLADVLHDRGLSTAVGDEGGFAAEVEVRRGRARGDRLAVDKAGYSLGDQIAIALDVASSEFYNTDKGKMCSTSRTARNWTLQSWSISTLICRRSSRSFSIEDGCDENDWDGWKVMTEKMGATTQLVGDDLFVDNVDFLQKGDRHGHRELHFGQSEPDRSLTETLSAVNLAMDNDYTAVISHRSGETEDATIADIAVATTPARSRPARSADPTGSPSTTNFCASKKNSVQRRLWW